MWSAQDPWLSFVPQAQPPENCLGALPAPRVANPPPSVLNSEHGLFTLAGRFSWGKSDCTFPTDAGEQHRLYPIYYAVSPSSFVTELQVSKMIAITENLWFVQH